MPKYINSLCFSQKNINKNTALEIALNTFYFIIGEEDINCFYGSLVSSVVLVCNGHII